MRKGSFVERWMAESERLQTEFASIDAENISYDYFKNLTSLSVLALGGVLGLSETVFADRLMSVQMLTAGGLVAAAGLVALQCQADIVQVARGRKAPTIWLRFGHRLAPVLLGAGLGAFLIMIGQSFQ